MSARSPQRRCVGCGAVRDKGSVHRLVVRDGTVVGDPAARAPGRGAYVCGEACVRAAIAKRAFARAFRQPVSIGDNVVDSVIEWQKSA